MHNKWWNWKNNGWATNKKKTAGHFPWTPGCLIGILLMVPGFIEYRNPLITGQYNRSPVYSKRPRFLFVAQMKIRNQSLKRFTQFLHRNILVGIKLKQEVFLSQMVLWWFIYHLESRWRNSYVLVYHGPFPSHLLGVAPSIFTTV